MQPVALPRHCRSRGFLVYYWRLNPIRRLNLGREVESLFNLEQYEDLSGLLLSAVSDKTRQLGRLSAQHIYTQTGPSEKRRKEQRLSPRALRYLSQRPQLKFAFPQSGNEVPR